MRKPLEITKLPKSKIYRNLYELLVENYWLSRSEIVYKYRSIYLEKVPTKTVKQFLEWARIRRIVQFRVRSMKPLEGYGLADMLRKVSHGTKATNSGSVVYEYRTFGTQAHGISVLEGYVDYKPKVRKIRVIKRKLTDEQILYVKINPDKLSHGKLATIMGVHHSFIQGIMNGSQYKNFDISKHTAAREKLIQKSKNKT